MTAFEHVMILISFVFALAITHLLSAVIAMIRAGSRVRYAFAPAGWMLHALITAVAWWLAYWDFRTLQSWDVMTILFNLTLVILLYIFTGLVTPEVPSEGTLDLAEFHRSHSRQYLVLCIVVCLLSIAYTLIYGDLFHVAEQRAQLWSGALPGLLISIVALIFPNRTVQNVCIAALLGIWPIYFYLGQHALQ